MRVYEVALSEVVMAAENPSFSSISEELSRGCADAQSDIRLINWVFANLIAGMIGCAAGGILGVKLDGSEGALCGAPIGLATAIIFTTAFMIWSDSSSLDVTESKTLIPDLSPASRRME